MADLDSDRYEVRQAAGRRAKDLLVRPELADLLAREFQQLLIRPEMSFEVRLNVRQWLSQLPKAPMDPPPAAADEEIDRLARQLDDSSYGVRVGAEERLRWLSENSKNTWVIMDRLKRRLADKDLSSDAFRRSDALWQTIRGQWLLSDPAGWSVRPVGDEQLRLWIDDLSRASPEAEGPSPSMRHAAARLELLDLLARDEEVPRVKAALEARLKGPLGPEASARVRELIEMTRPAMVAECWQQRRNTGQQHLLIGVPSQAPGALRPSHFDRIDDRVAHCVSGNSLSEGDYPVGVAFPHPTAPDAIFHLVDLSTPRRRMAYDYHVKVDASIRLVELTRRTLDRVLSTKRQLSDAEIGMLAGLDAKEVSRFAGRYFQLVEDELLGDDEWSPLERNRPGGQSSRHGMICGQLAVHGAKEAAPGLLDALRQNRFLPPTSLGPYRLPWLAALAIARRDPWADVDSWLASIVERTDELVQERPEGPELGATAARLLLRRRKEPPGPFGLKPTPESSLMSLGVDGYRFASPEDRKQVLAWWERQTDKAKVRVP